jgi:FlaA1/EpsC-like NDP-sugar epimerase
VEYDIASNLVSNIFIGFINVTFISSLAGLCLVIVTFLQLNLCVSQSDIHLFFTEKIIVTKSLTVPMIIGIITQVTLFCAATTCIIWSAYKHTLVVKCIVITLLILSMIFVGYVNISWEVLITSQMSSSVESLLANTNPLYQLLKKNELELYYGTYFNIYIRN